MKKFIRNHWFKAIVVIAFIFITSINCIDIQDQANVREKQYDILSSRINVLENQLNLYIKDSNDRIKKVENKINRLDTAIGSNGKRIGIFEEEKFKNNPNYYFCYACSASDPRYLKKNELSNDNYYINSNNKKVHSPTYAPSKPSGASAKCKDGTYSFSQNRSGTCSHHGGVIRWY